MYLFVSNILEISFSVSFQELCKQAIDNKKLLVVFFFAYSIDKRLDKFSDTLKAFLE